MRASSPDRPPPPEGPDDKPADALLSTASEHHPTTSAFALATAIPTLNEANLHSMTAEATNLTLSATATAPAQTLTDPRNTSTTAGSDATRAIIEAYSSRSSRTLSLQLTRCVDVMDVLDGWDVNHHVVVVIGPTGFIHVSHTHTTTQSTSKYGYRYSRKHQHHLSIILDPLIRNPIITIICHP